MTSESQKPVLFLNNPLFINNGNSIKIIKTLDDYLVRFSDERDSKIDDFDISIVTIAEHSFDESDTSDGYSKLTIRRLQEIRSSLRKGNKIVLLVEREDDSLFEMLMESLEITHNFEDNFTTELLASDVSYKKIVQTYCNAIVYFEGEGIVPICGYDNNVYGFRKKIDKGELIVLPILIKQHSQKEISLLTEILIKSIGSDDQPRKLAKYLLDFKILDEISLFKDKVNKLAEIEKINRKIKTYSDLKSILSLKNDELVDSVITALNFLNIKTFKLERYKEDLWILDDNKVKKIIIEVKGTKNNFKRRNINDLDTHREMNGLKPTFPALLIANTFSEVESIKEKEVEPAKDTLDHMNRNNILAIRTLDIIRLIGLIKKGSTSKEKFLALFDEYESGWIKVDNKIEIVNGIKRDIKEKKAPDNENKKP